MRHRPLGTALLTAAALVTALAVPASAVSASASTTSAAGPSAACTWRATPLPMPPDVELHSTVGKLGATDDTGGFSGAVAVPTDAWWHVATWKDGVFTDLGPFGRWLPTVHDMNRSGTVVGVGVWAFLGGDNQPFVSTGGGIPQRLPLLEDYTQGVALDVTDAGDITGYVRFSRTHPSTYAVVRWPAGRPEAVATLPGMPRMNSVPRLVDDDGAVAFLNDATGWYAVWRGGVVKPLGKLAGFTSTRLADMSNGRIVGSTTYNGREVGVYWDETGTPHVLPRSIEGDVRFSINRDGLIVGPVEGGGYGVWNKGAWVSAWSNQTSDIPVVLGDDGTVGGYRLDANGDEWPYSWRCS